MNRTTASGLSGISPIGHGVVPATALESRAALVHRSGRSFVPIHSAFIQNPDRGASPNRAGPLSVLVRRGDRRGLLAFLVVHSLISSGEQEDGWSTTLPLAMWARVFNTTELAKGASASSAATKVLTRLEQQKLVERRRTGRERKVSVTLLRPDGSGDSYTRPNGKSRANRFVRLSHKFWTEGWAEQLSTPAIAMLLVALNERPGFRLATERMPKWYGWSADTAERGLAELEGNDALFIGKDAVADPHSPVGFTVHNVYTVRAPFDKESVDQQSQGRTSRRGRG